MSSVAPEKATQNFAKLFDIHLWVYVPKQNVSYVTTLIFGFAKKSGGLFFNDNFHAVSLERKNVLWRWR